MIGRTNVGGGGGGNQKVIEGLATAIGVQYPVGWACTCTKGSTTLTAKTTTGLIVFNLPAAGTWTVKATTGSGSSAQPKVIKVTIAENEFKYINLRTLEVLTPANGLGNVGGTPITYSGSVSLVGNELHGTGGWTLGPAIDLTNYSKLTVTGTLTYMYAAGYGSIIGLAKTASTQTGATAKNVLLNNYGVEETKEVDISSLTGNYFLCREGNNSTNETITSIILT